MRPRTRGAVPARLEALRRRFDRWRTTRKGHSPIPDPLWASAVKLAGVYGLCRTARTLGLDYNALKRRVASVGSDAACGAAPAMTFVELASAPQAGLPECIVELEDPHGAKMRIQIKGSQGPDVVTAVSRVFWSAGR